MPTKKLFRRTLWRSKSTHQRDQQCGGSTMRTTQPNTLQIFSRCSICTLAPGTSSTYYQDRPGSLDFSITERSPTIIYKGINQGNIEEIIQFMKDKGVD
jgi:hypothetical protein